MQKPDCRSAAKMRTFERLSTAARPAVEAALAATIAVYDREAALTRFHRLSRGTILRETPDAARQVIREIERALRAERARCGHWTYDLNRHIALTVAHRAERARLASLICGGAIAFNLQSRGHCINSVGPSAEDKASNIG